MAQENPIMQVYRAEDGWRWRLKARNGRIVASSGERFDKKSNAIRAAETVLSMAFDAELHVEESTTL